MRSVRFSTISKHPFAAIAVFALAASVGVAHANPVIVNGSFSAVTGLTGSSSQFGSSYSGGAVQVTGWTTSGYNFVFIPGSTEANSQYGANDVGLYTNPTAPGGATNYLALDGAFNVGALTTTVTGLTPGVSEYIEFYFAGAQQNTFTGANTEQLEVSLGGSHELTPVLHNTSGGFTGWNYYEIGFTPTSTTETLSFLAIGTPSGVPPMSLLADVSIAPTPEPSSLGLMLTGLVGVGGFVRSRFKKVSA